MTDLLEATFPILTSPPSLEPGMPAWFADRQAAAWRRFLDTPAPKRGDETWRFSRLKRLDFSAFRTGLPVPEDTGSLIVRSRGLDAPAARFIFVNDTLIELDSRLPDQVICLPLCEALILHPELVERHFMRRDTRLGSAKWTALHEARLANGMFIHVPDDTVVAGAIEIYHWLAGGNVASFPHTLIVTGGRSTVRVIESFFSENDSDPGLAIAFNDLNAGPDSRLDYVAIQALNESSKIIRINDTGVAAGASARAFALHLGAAWARDESLSRLEGEGGRSDMLCVSVPSGVQQYDQRTFQHHISPGTASDLLFKNTLYDRSNSVFSGLISVDQGAHRTDAYQTCRNLFMSDDAEANSMPGLEINADDVKCSHGSTRSRISDEEIFYLRARGIDPDNARQLIARGFSVGVIERLRHPETEALVLRHLDAKLARIPAGE